MVLNINKFGQNTPIKQNSEQAQLQKKDAQLANVQMSQSQKAPKDSVSLTPQAQKMTELQKKANDSSEINQKRVDQLKKAIASGDYKVNPEKLAASMQNFELLLG
jgi:negative regulator of flagellin synthesis FlgM